MRGINDAKDHPNKSTIGRQNTYDFYVKNAENEDKRTLAAYRRFKCPAYYLGYDSSKVPFH